MTEQRNLPVGWTRLTMGEVGRWFGGGTPSKANPRFWTGGKIPWVSPKDMKVDLITDAQDHIADVVSQQVGQANVNGSKLQALAVPLPPLAEQTRIVAEVECRLSVVEELETVVNANLQRATRLCQSILQRAFSGPLSCVSST